MIRCSDHRAGSEGIRRGFPDCPYFARVRARSVDMGGRLPSLRKPSAQARWRNPPQRNAARFLLAPRVCGGRRREGSPFCGAGNG